jgi:hypothetical protein
MPTCQVYLPPRAAQRIDAAARELCLSRVEFVRAVALSVADKLKRDDEAEATKERT